MKPDMYAETRARQAAHAFHNWVVNCPVDTWFETPPWTEAVRTEHPGGIVTVESSEVASRDAWITPGANTVEPPIQIIWDVVVEFEGKHYLLWKFIPTPNDGLTIQIYEVDFEAEEPPGAEQLLVTGVYDPPPDGFDPPAKWDEDDDLQSALDLWGGGR